MLTINRPRKKAWSPTIGRATLLSPEGDILWQDPDWVQNTLADEGEASVLNVYFREQANPTKYGALLTAAPSETTTNATMTELVGGAYVRQQYIAADWSAPALDAGDMQTTAANKTFGAATGASWTGITHFALVTSASGTGGSFLLYLALSGTTTVAVGQSLIYTLRTKAQ